MPNQIIKRVLGPWQEFPRHFQILMGASFIDRLGGALMFPFFGLYVTEKFNVGMIEVGIVFAIWAVTSQVGNVIGGAMADKFGRKTMVVFGLIISAVGAIAMGIVSDLRFFYIAVTVAGLLGEIGHPAQQAMVADLLPEGKRAQGYGVWRVVANLAVMFGPLIGGWMANSSYLYLFISDAVTSIITAAIVIVTLPETKPENTTGKKEEGLLRTFSGYLTVFKDLVFVEFIIASILVNIVYVQMNSTLPVYLRDVHLTPPSTYGIILSINAGMVVLFQFWVTRKLSKFPPMLMVALGTFLYLIGFGMYGFVGGFLMFALAMIILTVGEMVLIPVAQALVAQFAPEDMRGRYMATYGIAWSTPFAIGPYLAGLVMEKIDPNWVWYGSIIVCFLAILGFLRLHWSVGKTLGNPMIAKEVS